MTRVSIIIPCYNDHRYIERSIKSALGQSYPNIELIVVDDGSGEKTKILLNNLESKLDLLLSQSNLGQSTARNNGIKKATGELILVLDSDDYFESDFVDKAVRQFSNDPILGLVTCYGRRIDETGSIMDIFKPQGGGVENFLSQNCAFGSSMFIKSDWQLIQGYDESMKEGFEDWEFYIRLMALGKSAYVIPEVLFNYQLRKNSTTSRANKKRYQLEKYILNKHNNLYEKHFQCYTNHLLTRLEREEKEKLKNLNRIEFRIGKTILWPLRKLKKLINS